MHFSLRHLCRVLLLAVVPFVQARAAEPPSAPPVAELKLTDAVVLGVIEGVTEFLPVSSTGHLIIATRFLKLESEQQLTNAAGQPMWHKVPTKENPAGVPLTVKLAADTYNVIIQVGAIAAVVFLYWRQLVGMLVGILGRSSPGLRLFRNIILAVIPSGVLGVLFIERISRNFTVGAVIAAQIAGGFLMLWAERWRRANSGVGISKGEPCDLSPRKALGIGFAQCLSLWPGTSRSMVTIVGGYLAGLSPAKAAEFSFLVGLPTLAGAALLKGYKSGADMIAVLGWSNMLVGCAIAAVTALVAVKFLVSFLSRHGLAVFAYYRFVMAAVLAAYIYL